jgi:purine-binding chemotaxis protein CheW
VSIEAGGSCLLVRAGGQLYALPLEHVEETMRPMPVRAVGGLPPFVLGMAVIRGIPVPVVDATCITGGSQPSPGVTRFVALKMADRRVALAVDEVIGVRRIHVAQLAQLPPLLAAVDDPVITMIGTLDRELLMVLRSGNLVPASAWQAIATGEGS